MLEAAGRATSTPCACAASRSPTRCSTSSPRTSTVFVVEQNRDAQLRTPADERGRRRSGQADRRPALRRLADHRPLHRRRDRRAHARAGARRRRRPPNDLHRQAPPASPAAAGRTASASPAATTRARSRPCAPAAATTRSRAAIIQACFELDLPPHRLAKLSGIGCSSKTPDYFLGASHGFNTVHGRMPSVLTGANLANRDLIYLGVSGDGDSASIGLGQFAHAIRRGVNMAYIVENNGVYGLTKGQFSATSDTGSKSQEGRGQPRLSRSTWSAWRCSSAPPSSPAASPATRPSWCR